LLSRNASLEESHIPLLTHNAFGKELAIITHSINEENSKVKGEKHENMKNREGQQKAFQAVQGSG
jgi:hypothetical protein